MSKVFSILMLFLAGSASAQTVAVWDFSMRDGKRTEVTRSLTSEFEEALSQRSAFVVLERRNIARLVAVIKNEKALIDIGQIGDSGIKKLKQLGATLVVFGDVFDDVDSGDLSITVTFQTFSGKKVLIGHVLMRRGLRHDASSRRERMAALVDSILPIKHHHNDDPPDPRRASFVRPELPSGCSGKGLIKNDDLVEVTFMNCGNLEHLVGIDSQRRVRVTAELLDGLKTAHLQLNRLKPPVATWQATDDDPKILHAFASASGVSLFLLGNHIPITAEADSSITAAFPTYITNDMLNDCKTRGGHCGLDNIVVNGIRFEKGLIQTQPGLPPETPSGSSHVSFAIPYGAHKFVFDVIDPYVGDDCKPKPRDGMNPKPMIMVVDIDGKEKFRRQLTFAGPAINYEVPISVNDKIVTLIGNSGDGPVGCDDSVWLNARFEQ